MARSPLVSVAAGAALCALVCGGLSLLLSVPGIIQALSAAGSYGALSPFEHGQLVGRVIGGPLCGALAGVVLGAAGGAIVPRLGGGKAG
ncbi:MAG: hypothetical protein RL071_4545 [Pseudomonadota bacterium]